MMCYYLNVQFEAQTVKSSAIFKTVLSNAELLRIWWGLWVNEWLLERWWNYSDGVKPKYFSQCHFGHYKYHLAWHRTWSLAVRGRRQTTVHSQWELWEMTLCTCISISRRSEGRYCLRVEHEAIKMKAVRSWATSELQISNSGRSLWWRVWEILARVWWRNPLEAD